MEKTANEATKQKMFDEKEYFRRLMDLAHKMDTDPDAKQEFDALIHEGLVKSEKELELFKQETGKAWDFSKEKSEKIFAQDDMIYLTPITEEYFDEYVSTCKSYAVSTSKYFDIVCLGTLKDEKNLSVAIIRKSDNSYIGYVQIHNTAKEIWELGIELLPEYCNQGYGYRGAKSFLKRVSEITGDSNQKFKALVAADNIPSQKLMKKLRGQLVGVSKLFFVDEENEKRLEDTLLSKIDNNIIELARQLDVEPRKLLSHVLDYRIYAHKL